MSVTEERNEDEDEDKSDSCDTPIERARAPRSSSTSSSELEVELSVQTAVRSTCDLGNEDSQVGEATQSKHREETRSVADRREVSERHKINDGCDQRAHNERAPPRRQILDAQNLLDEDDADDAARVPTAVEAGQWPIADELSFENVDDLKNDIENDAFRAQQKEESLLTDRMLAENQPEDGQHQFQLAMINSQHQHGTTFTNQQQQQRQPITSGAQHPLPDTNTNSNPNQNHRAPLPQIGFGQVQPRLSATSKRMRDYIETFKWRREQRTSYERTRVYQFFKCARTELVASLLFSLIVCYSLISCKNSSYSTSSLLKINQLPDHHHYHQNQLPEPPANHQEPTASRPSRVDPGEVSSDQVHAYLEHAAAAATTTTTSKLQVHLTTGLVSAFAVATLTQVFGHVSGCHLLPSVSLALYLKGHISRARLVAYLAAQSVGSLLGVGLLALLTSSQVTTVQYHLPAALPNGSLVLPAVDKLAPLPQVIQNRTTHQDQSVGLWGDTAGVEGRRKRSIVDAQPPLSVFKNFITNDNGGQGDLAHQSGEASPGISHNSDGGGDGDEPLHSPVIPPSETLLMSIEEQRERELTARRHRHREQQSVASSLPPPLTSAQVGSDSVNAGGDDNDGSFGDHLRVSARREKISNFIGQAQGPLSTYLSNATPTAGGLIAREQVPPARAEAPESNSAPGGGGSSSVRVISSEQVAAQTVAASGQQLVMVPLNSDFSGGGTQQAAAAPPAVRNGQDSRRTRATASPAAAAESAHHQLEPPAPPLKRDDDYAAAPAGAPEENRRQQPAAHKAAATQRKRLKRKKRVRRKQRASGASTGEQRSVRAIHVNLLQLALPDEIMTSDSVRECLRAAAASRDRDIQGDDDESERTTQRLNHCLGSSNGSQMFIFQLLGTLLVNLVYLVNVDPRRSDLGYKSLSIGLAYFLAHALTVNSGGFYGSPVQLLALASMATTRDSSASLAWHSEWAIYLIVPLIGGLFSAISHEYIDFTSARNCDKNLRLRRSFFSLEDLSGSGGGVGAAGGGVAAAANPVATPTSEIGYLDTNEEQGGPRAVTRRLPSATGVENPAQHQRRQKRLSSSAATGENSLAATTSSDDGHGSMGANSSLATLHLTDMNNNNNNNQQSTNELKHKSVSSSYLRGGGEIAQPSHQCGVKPSARSRTASVSRASILLDSNFLISCPAASRARKCQPADALASTTNRRAHHGQHQQHHHYQPGQFTCTSQFM